MKIVVILNPDEGVNPMPFKEAIQELCGDWLMEDGMETLEVFLVESEMDGNDE